jgi:hypothetical protein
MGCQDIHITLSNIRLSWIGHIHIMPQGRFPQDSLYESLALGQRPADRCKTEMCGCLLKRHEGVYNHPNSYDIMVQDRFTQMVGISESHPACRTGSHEKKRRCKNNYVPFYVFTCTQCQHTYRSRIGLFSHTRTCKGIRSSLEM